MNPATSFTPPPGTPTVPAAVEAMPGALPLAALAAVLAQPALAPAAAALADHLARRFGCRRVLVGLQRRGVIELVAASGGVAERLVGDAMDLASAAMDEAVHQGVAVHLPAEAGARPVVQQAHERWRGLQGGSVLSLPLVDGSGAVGALAFEWPEPRNDLAHLATQADDVGAFAAPVLRLLRERELPWSERLRHAGDRTRRWWRDRLDGRARFAIVALASAVLGLLAVPVPYDVSGRARVEGEQQRTLAAPADGFLKAVHARPGDTVRQGQVLAEMADQDLQLDRQRWGSELAQQESAYALAVSRNDRSQMVIALSRADQARAQLAKVEAQLQRAVLTAPFDGVVIEGDLEQSIDAPVERGAPLLLLAPAERHRIVIEVDERDIARVTAGQAGALSLSSMPWQRHALTVSRVTPMARAVEGRNVFDVEATLADGAGPLRPGLEGVARVQVGRRPLAWAWTHRVWDGLWLQAWAWWG